MSEFDNWQIQEALRVTSPIAWESKMEIQIDDRHCVVDRERLSGDGSREMSSPGTPPMERIKSGIMMLEYLQSHWGSLNRILNAVQECPNAFGASVEDCFASAADYLEAKAAEYKMAKVRAELESPPMRKFRGEVYAASCYGTGPVEYEFEVPATATDEEIEAAANRAAMDDVSVSYREIIPPKPRKKKEKNG